MKRASAIWLVLAIVVIGFLAGALSAHLFYARQLERPGSSGMMASGFFAERLEQDLDLTPDQRAAIDAILEETRSEAAALRASVRPRLGRLLEETAGRISETLTDDQRRRFADLRERYRGRSEHFFLSPPGPWGGMRRPPWQGRGRWQGRHGPGQARPESMEPAPPEEPAADAVDDG